MAKIIVSNTMLRIFLIIFFAKCVNCGYWELRKSVLEIEKSTTIGGNVNLTLQEIEVERILMRFKHEDYKNFSDEHFLPANNFINSQKLIETSRLFQFIKRLPKGASLHTHILAAASLDYIVNNITYRNNLYACILNGKLKLKFLPNNQFDNCKWESLVDLRKLNSSYDSWLIEQLTIGKEKTKKEVWNKFQSIFSAVYDMLTYKPVFEDYIYKILSELYSDNVMYAEFRGTFMELYDLNGTIYDRMETLKILQHIIQTFSDAHKPFMGAKYIYAPYRKIAKSEIREHKKILEEARRKFPNLIVGLDLVGFEDDGEHLHNFADELLKVDKNIRYFFHAGETNWHGTESDLNILDAILLGSTRIGHAYSLIKHPEMLAMVKAKHVAIEVCPISNQMLKLVNDLRNHPASFYIANGIPIVICNDDPTFWGVTGLSYDFYATYLAMTDKEVGLGFLKETALNSIRYSAMYHHEKSIAYQIFDKQWQNYMAEVEAFYLVLKKIFG